MEERSHLTAVVEGRVQGVYFRAFVQGQARSLGLSGFVRNLPDFRKVELQAEGDIGKLEALLALVKVGPPGARVESVQASWSPCQGVFKSFEIRH